MADPAPSPTTMAGANSSQAAGSQEVPELGPEELRRLAELIYKMMAEDLRIERERRGLR